MDGPPVRRPQAGGQRVQIVVGFYLALALVGFWWHGAAEGTNDIWRAGDRPHHWLALGPVVGALCGLAAVLAMRWLEPRFDWMQTLKAEFASIFGRVTRREVLWIAGASALGEEILFRGAMLDAWGWIPSSLIFALLHLPPRRELWPWTASAAVLGALLAGLTLATGNLGAAVVAHFVINALNMAYITRDAAGQGRQRPFARPA